VCEKQRAIATTTATENALFFQLSSNTNNPDFTMGAGEAVLEVVF